MYESLRGKVAIAGIRVSTQKQQNQGDSPEDQREQIVRFAGNNGITIYDYLKYSESAAKAIQPMQKLVDYCKKNKGKVDIVIVKSIDRFTRGGALPYINLKNQLDALGVQLVDLRGVIDTRVINTLAHTGMEYSWSRISPSRKTELLEAERAYDEVKDILTRVIGAEIRFAQLGYYMRQPPYGYIGVKESTPHGKRTVLKPEPDESFYIQRMFELKASRTLSDTQICHELNRLGFKTRHRVIHYKDDPTIIRREYGNEPLKPTTIAHYYKNSIYAGIIQEKWTLGKAVQAKCQPIISMDLYNKANKGFQQIIQTPEGPEIVVDSRKTMQLPEYKKEDLFPYRKLVLCPHCHKPLLGSASRGKSGKYFPAYHCRRDGHNFRVPQKDFDATLRSFVGSLKMSEDSLGSLLGLVQSLHDGEIDTKAADEDKKLQRLAELELKIKSIVRKIQMVESETAVKYMEEELSKVEFEASELKTEQYLEEGEYMTIDKIKAYLKYFIEHLEELVFDLCNPVQRAAFFGLIFTKQPTYDEIAYRTPKTAHLPEVNELFGIKNVDDSNVVISRRIELRLPG